MDAARRRVVATLGVSALAALGRLRAVRAAPPAASASASASAPALETVATFRDQFRLAGIGVTRTGRVFAAAPSALKRSRFSVVEVDLRSGALLPFPDAYWNAYKPHKPGDRQWVCVQALWVDERDRLWVLDSSLPGADRRLQPPKLIQFDIDKAAPVRPYTFGNAITPADAPNDVRIDLQHGYAYISIAGNRGGVLVVRLSDGLARLALAGDRSAMADPSQHLVLDGRVARGPDGKTFTMQTNGIALSPQRDWLYYRALTDHHYWRVPTDALIDATLPATVLSQQVQSLGDYALAAGLLMGADGTLYGGDLEHRSVIALTPADRNGQPGFTQRTLVDGAGHITWADSFALQNNDLYFADSNWHELNALNGYPRKDRVSIFRIKLPPQPVGLFAG
ncbi:hypothetical protein G3N59_09310 [Paraburkholderia sp. Ac-20340]|uniref:L-dopachrome tautomerase-related protein n=1 Tax=Paraburkholderia sp. Ac-20340 TaxID=2703888 RepID=UPI00198094BB|nr:L-dopachrome tautomerase-related protein [Paraburkholderia sp. Ac-20340]MBN3853573.1 hypothetical protein [Paraburkholderia sp. Ac-20340]